MRELRAVPGTVRRRAEQALTIRAIDARHTGALQAITEMAESYPYAHNVLGTPRSRDYVARLANHERGRWFGLFEGEMPRAAAHLALYGDGNHRDHSLWKVRHPLAHGSLAALNDWTTLLRALPREALAQRPGTVKVVIFLSEHERIAARAAQSAGFKLEGRLQDFYRLDEQCLVFGLTAHG